MRKVKTEHWERIFTREYREKRVLSIFPFIIMSGDDGDFHWTGKWFKYITVKQQKVKDRYLEFDGGWSYRNYWSKWRKKWIFIGIIDDKENN
jgi:hypothetical protein